MFLEYSQLHSLKVHVTTSGTAWRSKSRPAPLLTPGKFETAMVSMELPIYPESFVMVSSVLQQQ